MARFVLVAFIGCHLSSAGAAPPSSAPKDAPEAGYRYGQASRDGIGKFYEGREISHVMGHLGASWLERSSREREERPKQMLEALDLEADDVVADIGAGTGYFSFRIAKHVAKGRVLAVDIQPEMLAKLRAKAKSTDTKNLEPIRGSVTDPNLPEGEVDLALMVDAYHEFSHPFEMMRALHRAMKPGGRVVLVEYRGEDPSIMIKPLHKMTEAQAKKELAKVGFKHKKTLEVLPIQHILVFEKP